MRSWGWPPRDNSVLRFIEVSRTRRNHMCSQFSADEGIGYLVGFSFIVEQAVFGTMFSDQTVLTKLTVATWGFKFILILNRPK